MSTYYVYPKMVYNLLSAQTVKAMLLTDPTTYDAAYDYVNDIANEVTGGGYARQTVAGTWSSNADGTYFTPSGSVTFENITADVAAVVFYVHDAGGDAASSLIGIAIFDAAVECVAKNLKLTFAGVLFEGVV